MPKDPLPAGVLDRAEGRPLYYQLKQWISEQIAGGRFPPGSRLPDEQQLSSSLGVSRGVVRQAMSELSFEGLVSKQQGRGTFVAEPKVEARLMSQLPGLAADAAAHGQSVSSHVLGLDEVPAGEVVAQSLGIAEGTPVVRLERLRSIERRAPRPGRDVPAVRAGPRPAGRRPRGGGLALRGAGPRLRPSRRRGPSTRGGAVAGAREARLLTVRAGRAAPRAAQRQPHHGRPAPGVLRGAAPR